MNLEDFNMLFGALQRSAETARSAFYAFVIVYAAMLFYAMNTFVYPVSQNLLSAVREQIDSGKDCEPGHAGPLCLKAAPPLDRLNAEDAAHVLGYFQDRSTDDRVFHVPLIGLNSDRNWFWLINVAGSFLLTPSFVVPCRNISSWRNICSMRTSRTPPVWFCSTQRRS